ncbi:hypothetical protein [Gordonia aichiensis]|uniref:hypothetical protein n=1 Tax=Gordonia aichiensis TaxID=36820 RepID=UPI0032649739
MMNEYRPVSAEAVERLLLDSDPWMSCDECFDRTDTCVEALITRGQAPDPAMRTHLRACPACLEDVQSLLELVALERGVDASALERLLT